MPSRQTANRNVHLSDEQGILSQSTPLPGILLFHQSVPDRNVDDSFTRSGHTSCSSITSTTLTTSNTTRNGEEKTQQRGATQRPRHPHHRTATTGTNAQHTTVTNATDP